MSHWHCDKIFVIHLLYNVLPKSINITLGSFDPQLLSNNSKAVQK